MRKAEPEIGVRCSVVNFVLRRETIINVFRPFESRGTSRKFAEKFIMEEEWADDQTFFLAMELWTASTISTLKSWRSYIGLKQPMEYLFDKTIFD